MPEAIYDSGPNGLWVFLLVTLAMGGGAAFVSGKSMAETWRPLRQVPFYMLLLAIAVRFLHFALFQEPFASLRNLAVDFVILLGIALVGYRVARTRQMATQYGNLTKG